MDLIWAPLARALTLQAPLSEDDLALWDNCYGFLLVAGASLEAMLKAAAIHNTISLANRAQINLNDDKRTQLKRFEKYAV